MLPANTAPPPVYPLNAQAGQRVYAKVFVDGRPRKYALGRAGSEEAERNYASILAQLGQTGRVHTPPLVLKPNRGKAIEALPVATGVWHLAGRIFRTTEGVTCFTGRHLQETNPYKAVSGYLWWLWLKKTCHHLDPAVNGGRVRAYRVRDERPTSRHPEVIVFVGDDADVIARAQDQSKPAGRPGRWLSDTTWQDDGFGPCLVRAALAVSIGQPASYVDYWTRGGGGGGRQRPRRHPALDPATNGGKPRRRKVPKPGVKGLVTVHCLTDFTGMVAWDKAHQQARPVIPPGRVRVSDIAQREGLPGVGGNLQLSFVLDAFRRECPDAVTDTDPEDRRLWRAYGLARYYYDPDAFRRWLAGRDIREVARPLLHANAEKHRARVGRAVRFLQFVLTRGDYLPGAFARFLTDPPKEPLQPCGPVLRNEVYRWAEQAGIDRSKVLTAAAKQAGVKRRKKAFHGESYWLFDGPVTVTPLPDRQAEDTRTADAPGAANTPRHEGGRRRGRPRGVRKPEVVTAEKELVRAWKDDQARPPDQRLYRSASACGKAHGFDPSRARKILKKAMRRAGKKFRPAPPVKPGN